MTNTVGRFIWYELTAEDPAAAVAFYREVVGWEARPFGEDGAYTVLTAGGRGVGGVMALPDHARMAGARPGWIGYVAVEDVDASAEAVARAGGRIHGALRDISMVGRIAVVSDPQGAALMLMTPAGEGEATPPPGRPGSIDWHELSTSDAEAAFGFYAGQFGWTEAGVFDMGPMGQYRMFSTGNDAIGGMMTAPDRGARPAWLFYVHVDGIDAAIARIGAAGGSVRFGPQEVPGGGWIVQATDPQGVAFALVGPRA